MVIAYLVFLSLFGAERLLELWISRRNARIARGRGAVEAGAAHFPFMAALHALFLPACAAEALLLHFSFHWMAACLAIAAQGLRWWAIATLGWRWNVRVLVVPGSEPVRSGPYRFMRHPNYLAVAVEMLCVPLAGGAWICAAVFSALNLAMLAVRIPAEEHALYG
jgi:methyltransferase